MAHVPSDAVSSQPITPDFVYGLLLQNNSREARGFVAALTHQALSDRVPLVKHFLGDSMRTDGGTIGEPVVQPRYALFFFQLLQLKLMEIARTSIIGVLSGTLI